MLASRAWTLGPHKSSFADFKYDRASTQAGTCLMGDGIRTNDAPKHNGNLALVAGQQCVAHHGEHTPRVLPLRFHLPYGG